MKAVIRLFCALFVLLSAPVLAAPDLSISLGAETDVLDREQLEAMPQATITTATPYFEGEEVFSGPTLAQLLDRYDIGDSTRVTLRALNNYQISATAGELRQLDAIVATRMRGRTISVRNRGPFWIMLPLSDRPELDDEQYHRLMIWQLSRIEVE